MTQKGACPCHKDQLCLHDRTLIDTYTQLNKFPGWQCTLVGQEGGEHWGPETSFVGSVLVNCVST